MNPSEWVRGRLVGLQCSEQRPFSAGLAGMGRRGRERSIEGPGGVSELCFFVFSCSCSRDLMAKGIFLTDFTNDPSQFRGLKRTYLCYEVELLDGNSWVPLDNGRDFLSNQVMVLTQKQPGRALPRH